ncbi:PQQ-binding-like beta-propeller repeat protein [Halorussus sp. MSC15.2]|uniref:outer membrane protein assembly factor BamB family protein n=1 Tax=Halorussus sp. MSC15.2 TaxID=2283638 RepID=UPI0013D54EFD|nr:PQQ-binding-like beta-propeller repeat protein [Halorussus sp. MSC15.2]NEU55406.1 PQQ-binding-like beta-propeller repeat protein [Halorussus sp. MSC15.2]
MVEERVPKPGTSEIKQFENIDDIPQRDITQQQLLDSGDDPEGWLLYGNNYERHHHTAADIITPENVSDLSLEWEIDNLPRAGDAAGFQGTSLVVPGDPPILYQVNGPEQTRAINARTGDVLWYHMYHAKSPVAYEEPPANRGVAVLGDTLYKATLDYGVLALNRYNANEQWYYNGAYEYRDEKAEGPPSMAMHDELQAWEKNRGEASNYPLIVYEDTLLKGSMGGEWGVHGWASGITTDGNKKWHQGLTPPDQWVGDAWKHGGSTVWQAPALDPETGTAVIPTSNPGPWFGTVRPGFNPYTAGKVGIDWEDGEFQWNYQESPHDWWDYDSPSPAAIFEAEVDGETRKLASWPGKTAWVYTVDLETGELVQRSDEFSEHSNTWSMPEQSLEASDWILPNLIGGTDPQPSSYDPQRNLLFLKATNMPMKLSWEYIPYEIGEPYEGMTYITADESQRQNIDGWDQPAGNITAVDPVTGEIKWQDWLAKNPWGGLMSTVTGLTFAGTASGLFIAYDSETGDRLWTDKLSAGLDGNPVSWVDPKVNKQYVYIQGGGGGQNTIAAYSLEAES